MNKWNGQSMDRHSPQIYQLISVHVHSCLYKSLMNQSKWAISETTNTVVKAKSVLIIIMFKLCMLTAVTLL